MNLSRPELLQRDSYIRGEWHSSHSRYPVINPATGEYLTEVARAGAAEAQQAIAAAREALAGWKALTAKERSQKVRRWGELMLAAEETFGPVAAVFRFSSEAEAVAQANATESGLSAYCYTRDIGRAWRMGEALESGMVGINQGMISTEVAPFGGIKESGLGREGSRYGIEEYVEMKYLLMGL